MEVDLYLLATATDQTVKHVLTSAITSWQCLTLHWWVALNYAVIIQVKNGHWHPTYPLVVQKEVRRECVCHDKWAGSLPVHCVEMTFPGSAGLASRLPSSGWWDFCREESASFIYRAAGNNIVPAFGCVRSHISGCSIRNRPQCGTINPWPQQQICAVTAQHGAINQT